MNKSVLRGKVRQARGSMKAEWGQLTHNDRRLLDGKLDQMLGLLQERYGYTRERAADLLTQYLGGDAKKQAGLPRKSPQSRFLFGIAVGLAGLAVVGWFTFTKLFTGPSSHFTLETDETLDAIEGQEEPGEVAVTFMDYEASLD